MEEVSVTLAIPEASSEITTEISNQSINQEIQDIDKAKSYKDDGLMDKTYNKFKDKYEKIIYNCEIHAIDEQYRKAVAHAIRLLLLDIEKSKKVKLGNDYIPVQIVEKDIERLNFFVIEHAVNKFKKVSSMREIRNPVAYLKILIYNSINETDIDIDSKLRYADLID